MDSLDVRRPPEHETIGDATDRAPTTSPRIIPPSSRPRTESGGSAAAADLDALAALVKAEWDTAHGFHGLAILHYLRVGHALLKVRSHFPADRAYGQWFQQQNFVFSTEWGRQLRLAAQNEHQVREWWQHELEAGQEPSLKRCLSDIARAGSGATDQPVATPVATNIYPASERRRWLEEPLAVHVGRGQHATTSANDVEQSLRAWEDQHDLAVHDVLADHLPGADSDEIDNIIAEILAVLRGE